MDIVTKNDKAIDTSLTEIAYNEGKIPKGIGQNYPLTPELDDWIWEAHTRRTYEALKTKVNERGIPKTFADVRKLYPWNAADGIDRILWEDYCVFKNHFEPPAKKAKNGKPKGTWELTLTYSPKWFQDDLEAQEAFKTAEKRLIKYYTDELELYRSVGEYTRDGRAHLHILYRLGSGGKFTDKNINRAYPKWNAKVRVGKGVQGGHHAVCESQSDYAGYIEKHLKDAWHTYEHNPNADDTTQPTPP